MAIYEVYAKELVYQWTRVEANSEKEAMEKAWEGSYGADWVAYDGDHFEIEYAQKIEQPLTE